MSKELLGFPPQRSSLTLGELDSRKVLSIKNGFSCGSHQGEGHCVRRPEADSGQGEI